MKNRKAFLPENCKTKYFYSLCKVLEIYLTIVIIQRRQHICQCVPSIFWWVWPLPPQLLSSSGICCQVATCNDNQLGNILWRLKPFLLKTHLTEILAIITSYGRQRVNKVFKEPTSGKCQCAPSIFWWVWPLYVCSYLIFHGV